MGSIKRDLDSLSWLQWATVDLERGLGGVEVHARQIARELQEKGVRVTLSTSREDLENDWDVIHTHGGSLEFSDLVKLKRRKPGTIWIHTLHGTTLGRMAACGEWFWLRGYGTFAKELLAVSFADAVFPVHSNLKVNALLQRMGKKIAICGNGWDAKDRGSDEEAHKFTFPEEPFWLFIGRAEDPVKGASRLKQILSSVPDLKVVAIPGEGVESIERVVPSGRLSHAEIVSLLKRAKGLLVPSFYEGLPLVVLEALAEGTLVIASKVGGLADLKDMAGLELPDSIAEFKTAVVKIQHQEAKEEERTKRSDQNRKLLSTWSDVSQIYLQTIKELLEQDSSLVERAFQR